MKMKTMCALSIPLAVLMSAARAPADGATVASHSGNVNVTFSVPLQLTTLDPKYTKLGVFCSAQYAGDPSMSRPAVTRDSTFAITNGAYSGTIALKLTLTVNGPGEAWTYHCAFNLYDSIKAKWLNGMDPTFDGVQAAAKSGTPIYAMRKGNFTLQ